MTEEQRDKRPPAGTVRPEKVAEAKRRIAINFYDQPVVIKITIRELLEDSTRAA